MTSATIDPRTARTRLHTPDGITVEGSPRHGWHIVSASGEVLCRFYSHDGVTSACNALDAYRALQRREAPQRNFQANHLTIDHLPRIDHRTGDH